MKCILCKVCETNLEVLDRKLVAWFDTQANNVAIMEREADPAAIYHAYDLLTTDPAESFRQFLALAEGGSVWSMAIVGSRFEHGQGTAPDLAQAENWYLRPSGRIGLWPDLARAPVSTVAAIRAGASSLPHRSRARLCAGDVSFGMELLECAGLAAKAGRGHGAARTRRGGG
jgi:hypothetical protein